MGLSSGETANSRRKKNSVVSVGGSGVAAVIDYCLWVYIMVGASPLARWKE